MNVCVLGGSGDMAIVALKLLRDEPEVKKFTIADLNIDKARALAKEMGPKASAMKVDATDHDGLVTALRGFTVAMGYIGPFYRFEKAIASACIEAGTHYVSICDDYDAFLQVIELDEAAKKAGVTVIPSLGNSPGITNLLGAKGYHSMDKPERINVQWAGGSDEHVGMANILHVMHIFSGHTLQWLDGKEVKVKTGRDMRIADFPEPMGKLPVYYTGHAESVSLPRSFPDLKEVTLHGGIHPPYIARLATRLGDWGLLSTHARRVRLAKVMSRMTGLFAKGGIDKSVFRVDVHGKKGGRECHHYYTGVGHIAEITSIPTVEGTLMVGRGEVTARGVIPPERAFDASDFLERIRKRGVEMWFYEEG